MYTLGKIRNKYLIIDILSYGGNQHAVKRLLYFGSKTLRRLLLCNFLAFLKIVSISCKPEIILESTINTHSLPEVICVYTSDNDSEIYAGTSHLGVIKKDGILTLVVG